MEKRDQFLWMGYLLSIVLVPASYLIYEWVLSWDLDLTAKALAHHVLNAYIGILPTVFAALETAIFFVACRYLPWKTCWKMAAVSFGVKLATYVIIIIIPAASLIFEQGMGEQNLFSSAMILVQPVFLMGLGLLLKKVTKQNSLTIFLTVGAFGVAGISIGKNLWYSWMGYNSMLYHYGLLCVAPPQVGFWEIWLSVRMVLDLLLAALGTAFFVGFSLLASLPWRREEQAALAAARQAETA